MYKKLMSSLVLGALLATAPSAALANTMTVDFFNPVAFMDGQAVIMQQVAIVNEDGEILVPVREMAEAYNGQVEYQKENNTIRLSFPNGQWATIYIAEMTEEPVADETGLVSIGTFINDRLYIPASLMATCLGAQLEFISYGQDEVYRLIYHVR